MTTPRCIPTATEAMDFPIHLYEHSGWNPKHTHLEVVKKTTSSTQECWLLGCLPLTAGARMLRTPSLSHIDP